MERRRPHAGRNRKKPVIWACAACTGTAPRLACATGRHGGGCRDARTVAQAVRGRVRAAVRRGKPDGMHLRGPRSSGAGKASGRAGYGVPHGVGGQDGHGAAGVPAANPGAPERDRGNQPAVGTPHMQPALSGRTHHPGHAAQPHFQHCGFARVLWRFPKQFAPERAVVRSAKLSARRAGHGVSLQQSGGGHGGQPPGKALQHEL